jgi:hypothetical protein
MSTKERESTNRNEGEGSRTAARNYAAGVARTVASGKVEELADKAEAALEGPEGAELRRAEAAGAKGVKETTAKKPN